MSLVYPTLKGDYAGIPILKQAIFSMKMTKLIHNAIDVIILSQFLEYVTFTNVTNICLLSLSLFY